jgi:hypothetical protein
MRSQYLHEVLVGSERDPIQKALLTNPRYLDYSPYSLQISRYLKHFPADRLLVITSESLRHSRREALLRVSSFLGIDPSWDEESVLHEYHRTADKRVARSLARRLQSWGVYRAMSPLIPAAVKAKARGLFSHGVDPAKAHISDSLRRRLEVSLHDDIAELRGFFGSEFDGWGIPDGADRKVSQ